MIWFGSSSGVALCNIFPEARSVGKWLRFGWSIPVAVHYRLFVMLGVFDWHPDRTGNNSNGKMTSEAFNPLAIPKSLSRLVSQLHAKHR